MGRGSICTIACLVGLLPAGCYVGLGRGDGQAAGGADDSGAGSGGVDEGGDGTAGDPGPGATTDDRWRRLTGVQYRNAVRDLLGVEPDISGFLADTARGDSPFPSNAGVGTQEFDIEIYWQTANAVAATATADLPTLLGGCDAAEATCIDAFVERLGRRAFRRPLTDEQKAALVGVYEVGADESPRVGVQLVISTVLQSPNFLYVAEFGSEADDGGFDLDGWEIATRLSLLLTNSIPDDELLGMAEQLVDDEVLLAQADRLMQSDAFLDAMVEAQMHLTHISRLDHVARAEPEFDAELRASMQAEAAAFVRTVLADDGTIAGLLTTPLAFPDARLAEDVYGFGGDGSRVDVDDGTRVGLLTLPAFLASSPPIETEFGLVYRGNAVRTRLLCDPVPPPGVKVEFDGSEEGLTTREKLQQHQENPGCGGCHEMMDNIGFGLVNYDDLGRYAATDEFGTIDASGYVRMGDDKLAFDDARGMAEVLSTMPQLRACMAKQLFRLGTVRDPDGDDDTAMTAVEGELEQDGGDLRAAIRELVASDAFTRRRGS